MTAPLKIAIAGLGTVGGGVVKALAARRRRCWPRRAGRELEVVAMSARATRTRRAASRSRICTADPLALARRDADVVVELIGGEEGVARELVEAALANGKHVVTANKALLAKHGTELAALAERKQSSR